MIVERPDDEGSNKDRIAAALERLALCHSDTDTPFRSVNFHCIRCAERARLLDRILPFVRAAVALRRGSSNDAQFSVLLEDFDREARALGLDECSAIKAARALGVDCD